MFFISRNGDTTTSWALPLCLLAAAATCPSTAHSPLRRGPLHTLRAPAPPKSPSLAPAELSCCSRLSLRGGMAEEKPELLPANVVPRHYDLCITPDLKEFVFKGVVTIELDVVASTDTIELHGCQACACLFSCSPRNHGCAPPPLDMLRVYLWLLASHTCAHESNMRLSQYICTHKPRSSVSCMNTLGFGRRS